MKQVVQDIRKGKTRLIDTPVPVVQHRTALVRTHTSLVSAGTERALVEFAGKSLVGKAASRPDLVRQVLDKARREGLLTTLDAVVNRLDQPLPLGYSSSGTIIGLGEDMDGFRVGDRVACAGGGYAVHAEYAIIPRNLLAPLPENVDFNAGAFATMGAIALHGFRQGDVGVGSRVAIIGMGLLGLLAASIARAAGCAVLGVEIDPARAELARTLGFRCALREDAEEAARNFTNHLGFDLVQICADTASDDTVELAGAIARDRGAVVATGVVGTHLPRKIYYEKELRFLISRSYGPGRYDPRYEESGEDYPFSYVRWTEGRNMRAFLELIGAGSVAVDRLITHEFPIDDALKAYELIAGQSEATYTAVLLTYPDQPEAAPQRRVEFAHSRPASETGVKLGVIGAGNFATGVMLPAIMRAGNTEMIAIASASGRSATQAGKRFKFGYASTDAEQVIGDERINTIAILTRHHLHARYILAGLKAGKHVFCEKPLALNHDEMSEVQKVLAASSKLLLVGFNRRFAQHARQLKVLLSSSDAPLAMHYRVNAGEVPAAHWLHDPDQGGGRIIGETCHFIDLLTYLCGSLPTRVTASALSALGHSIEDTVSMTFSFDDGSIGTVNYFANGDRAVPKERLEVFQAGRVGILDDFRRLVWVANGKKRQFASRLRQDKGHRGEWEAFTHAILNPQEPPIPYEQIFAVTQATFAALQAVRSGEPISILPV
jgi:predicted dehydrogenase/threonine dehydrogenase-like Zn-dependent dehydrogenase